jgi:hypothetical protein
MYQNERRTCHTFDVIEDSRSRFRQRLVSVCVATIYVEVQNVEKQNVIKLMKMSNSIYHSDRPPQGLVAPRRGKVIAQ